MPKKEFNFMSKIVDRFDQLKYTLLEAQTFNAEHYGFPDFYYKIMETDEIRVQAYVDTFKSYRMLKGATVCEAGVGTLALTRHYLPYVKKAYLIESNPRVKKFIEAELKKHGWDKKVEFIFGDALKVQLPEQVDYVVGELMSIYCANEMQVQIFKHLRKFLKKKGKLIPERIVNTGQLCKVHFDEDHDHFPIFFTRHWPELLSSMEVINEIDLYRATKTEVQFDTSFKALMSGKANALLMQSYIELRDGVNFTGTDSLMPPTVIKLKKGKKLSAKSRYNLRSQYSYGTSLAKARFSII